MHKFESDFYGSYLKICLAGYLRGEKNFGSLEELVQAIKQDIENADKSLDSTEAISLKDNKYFSDQKVVGK